MEPKCSARSLRGALADEADAEAEEDAGEAAVFDVADLCEERVGGLFADAFEREQLLALEAVEVGDGVDERLAGGDRARRSSVTVSSSASLSRRALWPRSCATMASPRPSMFMTPREAQWRSSPATRAGQAVLMQRQSTSPSVPGRVRCSQTGQHCGEDDFLRAAWVVACRRRLR